MNMNLKDDILQRIDELLVMRPFDSCLANTIGACIVL